MRAALYTRISTHEGKQHAENQSRELEKYAASMGWEIAARYADAESGAEPGRRQLQQMMAAAAARKFDVVLVFDLSRLTREGIGRTFEYIGRLRAVGVGFWSATQQYFRTVNSKGEPDPAGDLFIAIAAFIAKEERRTMRDRVQAGVARARAAGKTLGRPRAAAADDAQELRARRGLSVSQLARELGCSRSTIQRRLRRNKK